MVAHELTHLVHPHYTTQFYAVMDAGLAEVQKEVGGEVGLRVTGII
ncbi:MAG: M48 family metallopeptidase [Saprospiraceae bacterium]|nr:M48 family metallopeptidase [Saprospiraceae bacterium]